MPPLAGPGPLPLEVQRVLLDTFGTAFQLVDHIQHMRYSMDRMELYLFYMLILLAVGGIFGVLAGFVYILVRLVSRNNVEYDFDDQNPRRPMVLDRSCKVRDEDTTFKTSKMHEAKQGSTNSLSYNGKKRTNSSIRASVI